MMRPYEAGKCNAPRVDSALGEVRAELLRSVEMWGGFHSAHQGYAEILEECDELWSRIKKKNPTRNYEETRLEATQVAAMAVKFMLFVCPRSSPEE